MIEYRESPAALDGLTADDLPGNVRLDAVGLAEPEGARNVNLP